MKKILITGSSKGIGKATTERFLSEGFEVYGLDLLDSSISHKNYHHYICDISKVETLPDIKDIEYLFNNAGKQNSEDDISNNLRGTMNVTEKYAFNNKSIKSVLFNCSSSAHTGFEFTDYSVSKGAILTYMKNVAHRLANLKVTVNSISLGGVLTDSNSPVINDPQLWKEIMDATPLKKWMSLEEVSDWVYFLLVINNVINKGYPVLFDLTFLLYFSYQFILISS